MRVLLLICLAALSGIVLAQNPPRATSSRSSARTFTSSDGSFQLSYPDLLIKCEKRQQGEGYVWAQRECSAYFPTCEEALDLEREKDIVVCLAYPRNKHTDTDTFEAATFSVGVEKAGNRGSCMSPKLSQIDKKKSTVTIGRVTFAAFETGEGGMSQGVGADILRTFHAGRCYELTTTTVTANPGAFDPPPREMTKADWAHVNRRLEQARDSFRFLK